MTVALALIAAAVAAVLAVELTAWAVIRWLRPSFQWLITPADDAPALAADLVDKYLARSFDPELGWCRRPGERAYEDTTRGQTSFEIDARGRRSNPGFEDAPSRIACFGDSFAFCRLVDDDQTWPHYLSRRFATHAGNYGVGNYGLDQALLRLERELPGLDADTIVMGVVPETILRVHSYWKHYFEYGNVLAFKPRFVLDPDGALRHVPPIATDRASLLDYRRRLAELQALDPFFARKFRPDRLAAPYLPKLVRRWRRHLPILWHLIAGRLAVQPARGFERAFEVVMRENAAWTATLYGEAAACALLRALIARFARVCRDAGKRPVLVVIPQPVDLARPDGGRAHQPFFRAAEALVPVVDLTDRFRAAPDLTALYAYAKLGPHPSALGNQLIADEIARTIEALAAAAAAADGRAAS